MGERNESWHIDRRVNVSIIVVLVVQLLGFGVLYGQLENRVSNIEGQQKGLAAQVITLPERLARLEAILERIERQISRGQ
ncbi:MAG: hypothetical protein HY057_11280 [Rhodospirillales bacterium]|nr:hypothetical protein [Rhodospirillales bacterium]